MARRIVKRREVYYADLGAGLGSEQKGIRPVVIIQNDVGNRYSPTVIVSAITSQINKAKLPTHEEIQNGILRENSIVLLEQVRTIDKCRLKECIGILSEEEMSRVDKALMISLGLGLGA